MARIVIHVSDDEYAAVKAAADAEDRSVSKYAHRRLFPIPDPLTGLALEFVPAEGDPVPGGIGSPARRPAQPYSKQQSTR